MSDGATHWYISFGEPFCHSESRLIRVDPSDPKELQGTHKCWECGKIFGRASILHDHVRTHTGEKPFKCSACGKAFARKNDRRRHEALHSGKEHVCKICGKQFARAQSLKEHSQGKGKAGERCSKLSLANAIPGEGKAETAPTTFSFSSSQSNVLKTLSVGQKTSHSPTISRAFECTLHHTPKAFKNSEEFLNHPCESSENVRPAFGANSTQLSSFSVPETQVRSVAMEFKAKSQLGIVEGQIATNDERYYCCPVCQGRYERSRSFASHLFAHLEDMEQRPYWCSTCNTDFALVTHLRRHQLHCSRPLQINQHVVFPCEGWGCDQVFKSKKARREHRNGLEGADCRQKCQAKEAEVWITIAERLMAFDSLKTMCFVSRDTLKITYKTSSLREAFMNAVWSMVQTLPDGRKINEVTP